MVFHKLINMIGIVINFCSNEKPFLDSILEQCKNITKNIVVSYGSHMYDGTVEDIDDYINFYKYKYPQVKFIKYEVDLQKTDLKGVKKRPTAYWCNLARWEGYMYLKDKVDWFLFLDADEIPESKLFVAWFKSVYIDKRYIYKLANYWYFKTIHNQATTFEDSILLVHKQYLDENSIFHDDERDGIIKVSNAPQQRMIMYNDKPIFHHYSWVRGKEGIAKKLKTWAHRDDLFKGADVSAIIDHMYKNDDINDFVHNYTYVKVDNIFNISL